MTTFSRVTSDRHQIKVENLKNNSIIIIINNVAQWHKDSLRHLSFGKDTQGTG